MMSVARKSRDLMDLLGNLTPMKITKWASTSNADQQETADDREPAEFFGGANVVTSLRRDGNIFRRTHAVLLDLDVPAYLVPSSTPGHSHLYIDVDLPEKDYFDLLDTLGKYGILETGYVGASKKKGATYLRLPWMKKYGPVVF